MQSILKKHYIIMLIPAMILFTAFGMASKLNFIRPGQFAIPSFLHSMVFILAAVTAVAGPVLIRALFAHSMHKQHQVQVKKFLSFQRKILWISLITPYLAFTAVLCNFPKFYATAIVLMALYAVYYYFPSPRRINFDEKIFRVK